MATNLKHAWLLKKYAKFLHEEELQKFNDEKEYLDVSSKGFWKQFSGENKDLILSYLESDHCLLTKQDIILAIIFRVETKTEKDQALDFVNKYSFKIGIGIIALLIDFGIFLAMGSSDPSLPYYSKESFYLPCSKTWIKGVAKEDSLLISYQLQNGNTRKFKIQFCAEGDQNGFQMRKHCTDILQKYFIISNFEHKENENEVVKINEITLNRVNSRKGYMTSVPEVDLKEVLSLCLTDISFPSFVAEVEHMLQDIGKN